MSLSENEESESCGVVDYWKTFHTINLLGGAGTKPSSSIVDSLKMPSTVSIVRDSRRP